MQLQLVVADLYLDPDALAAAPAGALPRLAGLEAVLRWGRLLPAPADWRAMVAAAAGRPDLGLLPPARVVAAAAGMAAGSSPWLAAPVHLVAGLDHLRLHAAGLLRLTGDEQAALVEEFSRSFGGDDLRLHAVPGDLLLTGTGVVQAQTQDPARFLGADVRTAPARGEDAPRLRRLGAEIEMWLHGHAINRARSRRGLLDINALWLWGGGAAAPDGDVPRSADPLRLQGYAGDAYTAGLWSLGGARVQAPPASFAQLLEVADAEHAAHREPAPRLVCISAAMTGAGDGPLARLDAAWLEPAVAALRDDRLESLCLHVGGQQRLLRRRDLLQFWRRGRPWWETLSA